MSGAGVRTGGGGAGAPYSSARGQCRRGAVGGALPGAAGSRGASGARGLLGQKVLREQLLRPPSAPPLRATPRPRARPRRHVTCAGAPRPRPPGRGRAQAGARAAPARWLPRTRAPPPPPPPALRPNVAGSRTGSRGGGAGPVRRRGPGPPKVRPARGGAASPTPGSPARPTNLYPGVGRKKLFLNFLQMNISPLNWCFPWSYLLTVLILWPPLKGLGRRCCYNLKFVIWPRFQE